MSSISFGMNYGSILGLLLVVISVLFYAFGILDFEKKVLFFIINILVITFFLLFSVIQYRDVYNDGFLLYSESLKIAVTITVFSSFVFGFWQVIFINFISTEYVELYIQYHEQYLSENANYLERLGFNIDDLLDRLESSRKEFTPLWIMISEIKNKALGGFLLGLIISIFTKKENLNKIT